jgi:glycosyltransferase involved in cell wall biosynthesis
MTDTKLSRVKLIPGIFLRVLICIDALGVGGKERQAVELVKGLARRRDVECFVICLESDDFYLHELSRQEIPVEFVIRRVRWDVGVFHKLYRTIKRYQPDLIHTNGLVSSFYTFPIARWRHIPLINGSIRNTLSGGGFRWHAEKLLLEASDYRVANSYAGLQSRGFSEKASNNSVIYNGFDFSRVERLMTNESPYQYVRYGTIKTVGMVAEFNRFKDYPTFIRAAQEISKSRNDTVFVTVGDGETLEASKKIAAGMETIKFLGKRKNVEEIVATFDIGVLSTFTEGISNSVMEYMALKKPVVATDGGGTQELIVDGETGFLVPSGNPAALAAKIAYLLDHPDIARRMGEAGEARLQREFSITRMVEETVKLYEFAMTHAKRRSEASGFARR